MAFCGPQREWSDQFKDKNKVVAWPQHNFEHFVVVVRSPSGEGFTISCMYVDQPISGGPSVWCRVCRQLQKYYH